MDVFRNMLRISRRDKTENEKRKTRVGIKDTIIKYIKENQLIKYEYVQ